MRKKTIIYTFFLSLPVILYFLILILPTFDDWTYLTAPYFGKVLTAERMLPWNGYWRPFDALTGSILGLNHHLFPALNHVLIFIAHVLSTCLIYRITNGHLLPAAFFFLSPGMLGTVLDIDSLNQAYANLWGLLALYLAPSLPPGAPSLPPRGEGMESHYGAIWGTSRIKKFPLGGVGGWGACSFIILLSTFCKENGIMYAFLLPLLCIGRDKSLHNMRQYIAYFAPMMALVAVYGVARIMLTPAGNGVSDAYLSASLMDHAKDMVQYIAYTWLPMDYEAIVFSPTRCLPLALATMLFALPFLFFLAKNMWRNRGDRMLYVLVAAYFIVAAPHLLTLVSLMHIYAGLPFAALIIDRFYPLGAQKVGGSPSLDIKEGRGMHVIAVGLFLLAAVITDIHHWYAAYESGLVGKEMAENVISESADKPQKVFVLNIDRHEEKYSIFNVIPRDAFGWGLAAQFYSDYTIANELRDTTVTMPFTSLEREELISSIAAKARKHFNYDALWVVEGESVMSISR